MLDECLILWIYFVVFWYLILCGKIIFGFFIFLLFIYFVNKCIFIVLILYNGWIILESCGLIILIKCVLLKLIICNFFGILILVFIVLCMILIVFLLLIYNIVFGRLFFILVKVFMFFL